MNKYREFTEKELRWIKSFEKIMKQAPNTLFFFVGEGQVVFTKDKNNKRYMTNGSDPAVDNNCTNVAIETSMECDGGGY